jgi:peroxiredoxin
MNRALGTALALVAIGAAIWYLRPGQRLPWAGGASQSPAVGLGPTDSHTPTIGQPAPGFTLRDVDGKLVRLSDFRGRTVIVNFWATWCIPCRQEFPELVAAYEQGKGEGLVVLAVDLQEDPDSVRKFAAEFDATFPIVIDAKGDVAHQYRLIGPPTSFFVDQSGILRSEQVGALTEAALARKLKDTGFAGTQRP